jgi:acyl-CoA thioester hydrolase
LSRARYDDLLKLRTTVTHSRGARIRHEYEVRRDDELIVTGFTVVAAVGSDGRVCRLPAWLQSSGSAGHDD